MTHKQAVLKLLSDRKPHSHHELYGLGCVAHSRISDLRRDGYRIDQWREDGLYLYQLKGELGEADGAGLSASPSTPSNRAEDGANSSVSPSEAADPAGSPDGGVLLLFDEHDQASIVRRGAYGEAA